MKIMVAHDQVAQVTASTEAVECLLACTMCAKGEKEGILVFLDNVMYVSTGMHTVK